MPETFRTQEELLEHQIQQDLFQRGLELMHDAMQAGYVVNLNMHTSIQKESFNSNDSLVVAPFRGKGKTLLFPEPTATGQRYVG